MVRSSLLVMGLVVAAATGCDPSAVEPDADEDAEIQPDTLSAMTFNIFHDAATDESHGNIALWEVRRDLVLGTIDAADAGVVGLQEALMSQVEWIRLHLPRYEQVGRGSEGDGSGWSGSILYEADDLTLEESGHFWLSSTPDVPGSAGGDGWAWIGPPRIVTWALLGFRRSGRRIYVYNTHLPPPEAGAPPRARSVLLLADRIAARSRPDVPFVLLGDLNAAEDEFPMRYLRGEASRCEVSECLGPPSLSPILVIDTWRVVHSGKAGSRCRNDAQGHRRPETFGDRVDYVLVSDAPPGDQASYARPQVLSSSLFTFGASCASDHLPVVSRLVFLPS